MNYEKAYIKNEALSLAEGETMQVHCCFCEDDAPKLSLTRTADGILYNCWRASCPARGFIGTNSSELIKTTSGKKKKEFKRKPYKYPTELLCQDAVYFLCGKYKLTEQTIALCHWKRTLPRAGFPSGLLMPLFNGQGYCYGHTTKFFSGHKAVHYLETETCMLHYSTPRKPGKAVLVEDVISAARISQDTHYQGISLLGTDLNNDKVRNLLDYGYNNVIIALDPDARAKELSLVNKYSLFFRTCRAALLDNDPKDMSQMDLRIALDHPRGDSDE